MHSIKGMLQTQATPKQRRMNAKLDNRLGSLSFFLKEINTFIQQECIKLIKRDSKDMYNATKEFHFK